MQQRKPQEITKSLQGSFEFVTCATASPVNGVRMARKVMFPSIEGETTQENFGKLEYLTRLGADTGIVPYTSQ